MRVKELIQHLQGYNQEAWVYTVLEDTLSPNAFVSSLKLDMVEEDPVTKNGRRVNIIFKFPLDY